MERTNSYNLRWEQLLAVRREFDRPVVTLPRLIDRDFRPREISERTMRFAEALALDVGWSGISDARARRAARMN
jgi:hypothetical protein